MRNAIIAALILGFLVIGGKAHAWFWSDEKDRACGSIEWEVQNAAQCLAYRNMWERWDEISKVYRGDPENSVGTVGCPIFISKIARYGFTERKVEKQILGFFVQNYDEAGSIKYKFKEFTGRDFCDVAEERGWIAIHLKLKSRENGQN
mgnify:CR=1 FL=1